MRLELTLALEIDERLGQRTDSEVRVINDLPLVVKGQIITTGILIYSRDDTLRANFETSVRKLYFDFVPAITEIYDGGLNGHTYTNRSEA